MNNQQKQQAARDFLVLKREHEALKEQLDAARAALLDILASGERVVVGEVAVVKEAKQEVDCGDPVKLASAVEAVVAGGWKKCLAEKFSATKLHALERTHPNLTLVIPYVETFSLATRKATAEEASAA